MGRIILVVLIAMLIVAFYLLGLSDYLSLAYVKEVHANALDFVDRNPVAAITGFFFVYVLVTGLSLPGAAIMTLAAGAVFGLFRGLVIVSFASTIGATLAMWIARTLLRDWVQKRFSAQLEVVNSGFARDGGFYLFSIRMVPLFPFFIVNLVVGLTRISLWQFYWVSQTGMLAGTIVYIFAGTQLATVQSVADVLSPGLILALSLLGLFPLLAKKGLGWMRRVFARGEES